MRTSARNHFNGQVSAVKPGAVNDEITLRIDSGLELVAIITHGSAASLGLAAGKPAFALVKASSVVLVAGDGVPMRLSARNQLQGVVGVIRRGAVNAEVAVELPGGAVIVGVVTDGSVDALGLAVGQPATVVFKASSVILGVSG